MESQKKPAQNQTLGSILKNSLLAAFGLFCFGVGVYLTIQANIGVAPWDTLYLGVNRVTGIQYGTISIITSFVVIGIDLLLKERIGIGMLLDALIVGKTVDLMNWLNPVPAQQNLFTGILVMLAGLAVMGFSQYLYMTAALGCGPRDSLLVALNKRIKNVSAGTVWTGILITVFLIGWALGGPVGIGTIIAVCLQGVFMQLAFNIMKFKPTEVEHQDLVQSLRVIFRK